MSYDLSLAQVRGTAAQLKATNATIESGALCKETDTNKWKVGTGAAYNDTAYTDLSGEEGRSADDVYQAQAVVTSGIYEAAITQSGSGAPTAIVFTNTTGLSLTWERNGSGDYQGVFSTEIDAMSCGLMLGTPPQGDPTTSVRWASAVLANDKVQVATGSIAADGAATVDSTYEDDILSNTIVKIIIP